MTFFGLTVAMSVSFVQRVLDFRLRCGKNFRNDWEGRGIDGHLRPRTFSVTAQEHGVVDGDEHGLDAVRQLSHALGEERRLADQ